MEQPLDKMGQPYTPVTEADMARWRAIPYPEGFSAHSDFLREHEERRAKERPVVRDMAIEAEAAEYRRAQKERLTEKKTSRRVNVRRGR